MGAALKLFDELGITYVPPERQRGRVPLETCCGPHVDRLIAKHGESHVRLVLTTITETAGNAAELISYIIGAVSDVILRHPGWTKQGWLEAFDQVRLEEVRNIAQASRVRPVQTAVAAILCFRLETILGPSAPPKQPRPARIKLAPKPSRRAADAAKVRDNIKLGVELLKLKHEVGDARKFGQVVRHRFHIDPQHAAACMRAARAFGDRVDTIAGKLTWRAVLALSARSLPADVRRGFEQRAIAGERIGAPEIRRVRDRLKAAVPKQSAPEPMQEAA